MNIIDIDGARSNFRQAIIQSGATKVPHDCPEPQLIHLKSISPRGRQVVFSATCAGVRDVSTRGGRVSEQLVEICQEQCIFRGNSDNAQNFVQLNGGSLNWFGQ